MTNRTLSREFGPMIRLLPDQFSQNTLLPDERVESIFAHETSTQNQPRHDQMTERERYRPTKTRTMMTMIVVAIACSLLKWIGKSFWKTGTQAHKHSVSQWISWRLNECIKWNGFSSDHPTVLWIYISESSITQRRRSWRASVCMFWSQSHFVLPEIACLHKYEIKFHWIHDWFCIWYNPIHHLHFVSLSQNYLE